MSNGLSFRIAVSVACMLTLVLAGAAFGCVGARPLAMGGAFTGLADDANTTYWNPAGLTQLKGLTTTYMRTTINRDDINYQDYVSLSAPIGRGAAIGLSWISDHLALSTDIFDEENWYWLSLAYQMNPETSIGLNVRSITNSYPGLKTDLAFDIGLLHKIDPKWTAGLLIQNANEPKTTDSGTTVAQWSANFRPGCAYRPDRSTIVSLELYDATGDANWRSLRIGYERLLPGDWTVRAGYYGLGLDSGRAATFGFGKEFKSPGIGNARDVSLDVTAMVGDINTVFTSVTMGF